MVYSVADREFMSRALELAARGRFTTSPNPSVGCVLVIDGEIVGEGYTRPVGGNHAEVEALNAALRTDSDSAVLAVKGATAYVTLEPCSHTGKTGPCVQALIDAGISRAVIACEDPNPKVAGEGIALLEAAGIEVACGLYEDQARELNKGFIKRHEQGLPWVVVKIAASLDGRTAMASGQSQWITTPASRKDVQRLRAANCAIITGIGTQLMDDPSLTVRITNKDVGCCGQQITDESRSADVCPAWGYVNCDNRWPRAARKSAGSGSFWCCGGIFTRSRWPCRSL